VTVLPSSVRPRDLLLASIVVLGFGVRLAGLGDVPLADSEAIEALWAAQATDAGAAHWPTSASPAAASAAYAAGTWLIFQTFPAGDAAARLLPALAGGLVVLLPWLLRKRLGTCGALAASLLLVVSASVTAVARTAGGASLAIAALGFGVVILLRVSDGEMDETPAAWLVAVCLALGLGSGPAFFHGLVVLAAALAAAARVRGARSPAIEAARAVLRKSLLPGLAGAAAIALGLGLVPGGATSLAEGLRQWLVGWVPPGDMHPLTPVAILAAYEPAALAFGVAGFLMARKRGDAVLTALGWSAGAAVMLAILYPGRSGEMTAWASLPLAILAGPPLAAAATRWVGRTETWVGLGFALLLSVLWAYAGVQLSAYVSGIGPGVNPAIPEARLAVALGAILVGALAALLIGVGWSWEAIRLGGGLAGAVLLTMMTISSSWNLNHGDARFGARELWQPSKPAYGLRQLSATIDALSRATRSGPGVLTIRIEGAEITPSLAWALRGVPRFSTDDTGLPEVPPLVLRPQALEAALPGQYLGQTMILSERWDFRGPVPPDLGGWLWRRRIPVSPSAWVLYVRADLATLGESQAEAE
jgi:hypothetical protein